MEHVDDGQLNALLDGELEAAEAATVRSHLEGCSACRSRFEEARRFLEEAGALLDVLAPPAVEPLQRAAGPMAIEPPAPRRVPVTAKEAAVDPAAGPRRVPVTAKEVAIDLDARTQKTPAVRPLFSREGDRSAAEGPAVAPRRPRVDWTQLSWAAIVVLALSVGYLANEVRRGGVAGRESAPGEAARGPGPADTALGAAAPNADAGGGAGVGASELRGGAGARESPAGARGARPATTAQRSPRLRKPPTARGPKPPSQDRAADLAIAGAEAPRTGAGAPAAPAQPAAAAARERAAPTQAPVSPAAPPSAAYIAADQVAPPTGALTATREGARLRTPTAPAASPGFRRISLDEAARRLSGSVRLIDGLIPGRVEVGSGRLVQGSDAGREVIRVLYTDAAGRRLTLEQQRLFAPTEDPTTGRAMAEAATGMTASDTIASTSPQGTVRIRWLDGRGFWLSLTGTIAPDSLRALVARVW
jgi:anti-sigma factor RsiW